MTPDFLWKVIVRGDDEVIAWLIPNEQTSKQKNLDRFIVSINDLEERLDIKIPVNNKLKNKKPHRTWLIDKGFRMN